MNNTKEHQKLVDDILHSVGSYRHIRLWIRVVGFDESRKIKYGINGESDLDGIIAPHGRKLCIEVKTGKGKLSVDQIKYRDMILKFGGIYIKATSVDQVLKELKDHGVI